MTEDDSLSINIIEQKAGKIYRAPWVGQGQAWGRFVDKYVACLLEKGKSTVIIIF